MFQSSVIEMGLSDHELIHCSRKKYFLKLNEHYEISLTSMKNFSDEIFVEKLRSIKLPNYSNRTFVNDVYQDFATKFSSVVYFVASILLHQP